MTTAKPRATSDKPISEKQTTIAKRIDRARVLLEHRLSTATVASYLQQEFKISRSQAYSDVGEADKIIAQSDDGPPMLGDFDYEEILKTMLFGVSQSAYKDDPSAAVKYMKCAETVKKWIGRTWDNKPAEPE